MNRTTRVSLTAVAAVLALLLTASPARATTTTTHVTVAWLIPDTHPADETPTPHGPIWPQGYLDHVDTTGQDVDSLDHVEIPCGRWAQVDAYKAASARHRQIVDDLIAGGTLDLLPGGKPADHEVYQAHKFVYGGDCPPPPPEPCPFDDSLLADDPDCVEEETPPTTQPPVTVPPTVPPTVPEVPEEPTIVCPTADEGITVEINALSYPECPEVIEPEPEVAPIVATPAEPPVEPAPEPATLPNTGVTSGLLALAGLVTSGLGLGAVATARRGSVR